MYFPPWTVLGVTSQTFFTYFAYAKDLNFAQGGWGKIWIDGGLGGWVSGRADGRTDDTIYIIKKY